MRLWMFVLLGENLDGVFKFLSDRGFTHLVVRREREIINLARDYGFKVYVYTGVFKLDKETRKPVYLAEDLLGRKHVWFGSGCPNNPELKKRNLEWIEETVMNYDIDGIFLDGIRFASPGSSLDAFFTCFCENCYNKMEDYGYDPEFIRSSLLSLYYDIHSPTEIHRIMNLINCSGAGLLQLFINYYGVVDWLFFKSLSIVEHVRDARNVIKSVDEKIELGLYTFTPSLSLLVGQNYVDLADYVDTFHPMMYRLGDGVACINYEISALAREILSRNRGIDEKTVLNAIYSFLGFAKFNLPITINELLDKGVPHEVLKNEILIAKKLVNGKALIEPILGLVFDEEIEKSVKLLKETDIDGMSFFLYKDHLKGKIVKLI